MRSSSKEADVEVVRALARRFLTVLSDPTLLLASALASSPLRACPALSGRELEGVWP